MRGDTLHNRFGDEACKPVHLLHGPLNGFTYFLPERFQQLSVESPATAMVGCVDVYKMVPLDLKPWNCLAYAGTVPKEHVDDSDCP